MMSKIIRDTPLPLTKTPVGNSNFFNLLVYHVVYKIYENTQETFLLRKCKNFQMTKSTPSTEYFAPHALADVGRFRLVFPKF